MVGRRVRERVSSWSRRVGIVAAGGEVRVVLRRGQKGTSGKSEERMSKRSRTRREGWEGWEGRR